MLLVQLDTGIHASELCNLKFGDLDLPGRNFRVLAKGNKYRTCYFGRRTAKRLTTYLRKQRRDPDEAVFLSEGGIALGRLSLALDCFKL